MNSIMLCTLAFLTILQIPPNKSKVIIIKKTVYVPTTICPCEYTFDPVCGSDGIKYYNQCLLECASEENKNRGLTPIVALDESKCTECICQNVDLPVCTLDGVTYPNECELGCENLKRIQQNQPITYLAYRKPCLGPPCGCPTKTTPVCGTDNVLYRNQCVLHCAATNAKASGDLPIEFKNAGACLNSCQCPSKLEPVCGSDTVVYDNLCMLTCQNNHNSYSKNPIVTVANRNICKVCDCSSVLNPVCGSDGKLKPKTYQNPCHLDCDARRTQNPYLKKISEGPCPKCYCTDVHSPVCGTDHKTYENLCKLRCANYNLPNRKQQPSIFHYGECKDEDCNCSYCPDDYQPMCGTDGVTYSNLCSLNCNNDCNKKKLQPEVFLAKRGSCSL